MSSSDSEGSDDSHEESISSAEEGEGLGRSMPARRSRGSRMTQLQGEEKEADDLFWNQDAFKEEDEADRDYVFKKQNDVVDSDFDISEAEEEVVEIVEEKRGAARKSTYSDPVLRAQQRRARALKKRAGSAVDGGVAKKPRARAAARPLPPSSMSRRRSTASKSKQTSEAQAAHKEAQKGRTAKRAARIAGSAPEKLEWTQEEMLTEAVSTEWENVSAARRIMLKRKASRGAVAPARPGLGDATRVKWTSRAGG